MVQFGDVGVVVRPSRVAVGVAVHSLRGDARRVWVVVVTVGAASVVNVRTLSANKRFGGSMASASAMLAATAVAVHSVLAGRAALGVNVEELNTECRAAAETGHPLFHAVADLRLPPDVSEEDLRIALENVAADLMVDVKLAKK